MLERLVSFVTVLTLVCVERSQVNRVLERTGLNVFLRRRRRVVDYRVADVTVIGDNFAGAADVLTVVTAEAAGEIKMADVVRMGLPIRLHLGKKVSLKNTLNFRDRAFDRGLLLRVHVLVIRLIELIQTRIN